MRRTTGAGFALVLVLGYVGSCHAKAVTITNGVYTMCVPSMSMSTRY